jgi:Tfp pilus assembly protein PilE
MITVAIIAIIAAIAIPAYDGYISEARLGVARSNADPLRIALEDYWLDGGEFDDLHNQTWDPTDESDTECSTESICGNGANALGWEPQGNEAREQFTYLITAATPNFYTITVTHLDLAGKPVDVPRN